MAEDLYAAIPADRRETARTAMAAAFGERPHGPLTAMTGGASALTFRTEVGDRTYLLRLEGGRDLFRNPLRSYPAMKSAAEAGIAPALHHADAEAGVAVMDFLTTQPLETYPGGPSGLARGLGELTARLQATAPFSPLFDFLPMVGSMLRRLMGSTTYGPGLLDAHLAGYERIAAVYPWDGTSLVSSHNDPNPLNVLFDGERLWLIDWEMAFRNDPLADVASLANNFAASPELETALLTGWLGRAPDRSHRARLRLMRGVIQLYYASLMPNFGPEPPETDMSAPTPAQLKADVESGRMPAGTAHMLRVLAKMHLRGFLDNVAAPGFDEALIDAGGR